MNDPKAARDYLTNWLANFQKASEAVPFVQKAKDTFDWQCEAISQQPKGTESLVLYNPSSGFAMSYGDIPNILPMIPNIDPKAITHVNTIAASGASGTFEQILKIGEIQGEVNYVYYREQSTRYQALQRSQDRINEVQSLVQRHCSANILGQYKRAVTGYYNVKSGSSDASAAALEMRTLLDNIKGELFERARTVPRENMTWDVMVQRVYSGAATTPRHTELLDQGIKRSDLINYLSTVAKRRGGGQPYNFEDLWAMVLDHIYILLVALEI